MNLNYDALSGYLQQQPVAPCYLIYGQEVFLAEEAAKMIVSTAQNNGYLEREVFYINARFNFKKIEDSIASPSLFSPKKILELRFESDKVSKKEVERISTIVNHNSANMLIIQAANLHYKVQKEKWFTAIINHHIGINAGRVFPNQLVNWITNRARQKQLNIAVSGVKTIAEFSEGNLLWSEQILQQLKYLGQSSSIDESVIREILADNSVFQASDLVQALLTKTKQAKKIAKKLESENQSSILVASILGKEIETLLALQLSQQPINQIFSSLKIWPSKQKQYQQAVNLYEIETLKKALAEVAYLDKVNKGVMKGDAWLIIHQLVLDLVAS